MPRKSSVPPEKRAAIIKEVKDGGAVATVAKKHGIAVPTLYLWVRQTKKGGANKKGKKTGGRLKQSEAASLDLSSMMEEIAIARKFKGFLAELGYSKR